MPMIRVHDIDMYCEVQGQGEPVVLILASDVSEWEFRISWTARSHRVLAFDNRGAGRTDKPDAPYTIAQIADDASAVIQPRAWNSRAAISLGGRIAMELALSHPAQVASLVLVSSSAHALGRRRIRLLGLFSRLPVLRGKYPLPRYASPQQPQASTGYDNRSRLHELAVSTVILHGRKGSEHCLRVGRGTTRWHPPVATDPIRRRPPISIDARTSEVLGSAGRMSQPHMTPGRPRPRCHAVHHCWNRGRVSLAM